MRAAGPLEENGTRCHSGVIRSVRTDLKCHGRCWRPSFGCPDSITAIAVPRAPSGKGHFNIPVGWGFSGGSGTPAASPGFSLKTGSTLLSSFASGGSTEGAAGLPSHPKGPFPTLLKRHWVLVALWLLRSRQDTLPSPNPAPASTYSGMKPKGDRGHDPEG